MRWEKKDKIKDKRMKIWKNKKMEREKNRHKTE